MFRGEIVAALPVLLPSPCSEVCKLLTSGRKEPKTLLCLLLVPPGFVLTCLIYTNTKDCLSPAPLMSPIWTGRLQCSTAKSWPLFLVDDCFPKCVYKSEVNSGVSLQYPSTLGFEASLGLEY